MAKQLTPITCLTGGLRLVGVCKGTRIQTCPRRPVQDNHNLRFLEAGPLPKCYRPLYARLSAGGIPGIDEDCLIEVLGNVYGQNDAPAAWYKVFNKEVLRAGFERSKFYNCLYWMKENGKLVGALGAHVDDTATGGSGSKYTKALEYLRQRFPYRKWRMDAGEFCGAHYQQDPIVMPSLMPMRSVFCGVLMVAAILSRTNCSPPFGSKQCYQACQTVFRFGCNL